MKNKMVSLDTVFLFILVLSRVAINDLVDIPMPKRWELVSQLPFFGTLLPQRGFVVMSGRRTDPLSFVLIGLAFLLLLVYILIDLKVMKESYPIKFAIVFSLIFLTVIVTSVLTLLLRHVSAPTQYAHDGGVIQTEVAIQYFLAGKNPYTEDYLNSPYGELRGPHDRGTYHYPYFPFTFLFPTPFYLLSQKVLGWYDQRFVYLPLFSLTLLLLLSFATDKTSKLFLLMIVGFNPTMATDVIVGTNDSFVFFWIVLSLFLLLKERSTLSALALGLACASKATAWLLIPFYLLYVCRDRAVAWENLGYYLARSFPLILSTLLFILPIFLWDPTAMIDDVWHSNIGTSEHPVPINGWGFANFILALGRLKSRSSYFPFWTIQAVICLPLLAYLLKRQVRRNSLHSMLIGCSLFLLAFLYLSRFFYGPHIGFTLALFALGYFCERETSLIASTQVDHGRP